MGGAMALRLRDLGWPLAVLDIDPAAAAACEGAAVCASAAELAARCDCVIVVVVDAAQVDAVLFGAGGVLGASPLPATVMLCPTIAPDDTERIAARLAERGVACIDAPISGGPARARDGSMSTMLAAPEAVLERHRVLLDALSSHQLRISERAGDGARTKLANNLLAGIHLAGAAEVLALAERIGLDPACTLDVIEQSSGQSWIGSDRMRRAIAGDFAPRARTTLLAKDTRLALEMARHAAMELPLGAAASAAFARACEVGFAALDDASLLELNRQRAP
jgi:3-hydroxyisobutyrate dehydrogenase-like beta-hydroxyacid dehydrogenase